MKAPFVFAGLVGAVAVTAVWAADVKDAPMPAATTHAVDAAKPTGPAVAVDLGPIHNGFRLGRRIISGSCPYGDAGFKALAAQGVKTILSVDGAKPDADLAKKYGMRYVHIPINYGGVTREQQLAIGRVARDLKGPIFIHCHHGIHRGPTAAVIAAMVTEAWTADEALAAMKQAGTGTQYTGLWATVQDFKVPTRKELKKAPHSFPAYAPPEATAVAMVEIDDRWAKMGQIKDAGWKPTAADPDLDPAHEVLQLRETFRELARTPDAKARPADFIAKLNDAENGSAALEAALRAADGAKAGDSFKLVANSCKSCHALYRDPDQLKVG